MKMFTPVDKAPGAEPRIKIGEAMSPKFGTSGLRGLATDLTPELVDQYICAFVHACPVGAGIFVGRDLRASSPTIARSVISAALAQGVNVTDCGAVPTPALALAAMEANAAAVMVTGSHIPADRNGLKFYTPLGEITKADESAISAALDKRHPHGSRSGILTKAAPGPAFVMRYLDAFGPAALRGVRIGVWSHSAVGRDLLIETLQMLGANVVEFARADHFIPVDTEAVPSDARALLHRASKDHDLHAIVSTDGDGDRPLLADGAGVVIPGDILGQLTARMLGAKIVVTPVSSNTGVNKGGFERVILTKIGSPHVIAGIEEVLRKDPTMQVVGYEANGGFLLGFDAQCPNGVLPALMTRDSHLPIIAPLVLAGKESIGALVSREPQRFTAADRLENVPTEKSAALVTSLTYDSKVRDSFLEAFSAESFAHADMTDGLRLTFASGRIIHLRPSGNAPELRFYAEAESQSIAQELLETGITLLRTRLKA